MGALVDTLEARDLLHDDQGEVHNPTKEKVAIEQPSGQRAQPGGQRRSMVDTGETPTQQWPGGARP